MATTGHESAAIQGCLEAFERCERVLDAISDEVYSGGRPEHAPIGAHLRHALDHAICFARGLDAGLIDYDGRDRDEILEQDRGLFREALHGSMEALKAIPAHRLADSIQIRHTASLDSEPLVLGSTVERELAFLSSHTIHHLATIVHICREQGVDLPEELSLAFSTAAYLKASAG